MIRKFGSRRSLIQDKLIVEDVLRLSCQMKKAGPLERAQFSVEWPSLFF